jgi:hypothetical protein
MPPDERDKRILAVWKEKLMAEGREADKWRPLYQMAAVRRVVLKRLQASIKAHDDAAIVLWGSKRCLTNYPLAKELLDAVAAARERLGKMESAAIPPSDAAEHTPPVAENGTAAAENDDHPARQTASDVNGEATNIGEATPDAPPRWKWPRLFSRRAEPAEVNDDKSSEEGNANT